MLSTDVLKSRMHANKLHIPANRLEKQLKDEKLVNRPKFIRRIELENKFMEGINGPLNLAPDQNLLKEKDKKIQALRQRLNLTIEKHMHMPNLIANQGKIEQVAKESQAYVMSQFKNSQQRQNFEKNVLTSFDPGDSSGSIESRIW